MLSKCEIHNVDGVTVKALDEDPVSTGFVSVNKFDPQVGSRGITDRNKMQAHGAWTTRNYRGGISIDIEGTIQADTPTNTIAQLDLVTIALFGQPTDTVQRKNGTLVIRRLDKGEDWQIDFIVTGFSAPLTADTTVIQYLITLFTFEASFTGVSSGNKFFWT